MVNTVFTHTNERQYLGAQVSEYFLRHNSATPRDVEVRLLHSHDFEFLSAGEEYSTISAGMTSPVRGQEITLTMSGGLLQALLVLVPGSPAEGIADSFDGWVWYDDIDYIVRTNGERVLESPDAAQAFVGAVVLVVDGTHLPDDAALDALAEDVGWLSSPAQDSDPMFNFFEPTGGRGRLLPEQLGQHRLRTPASVEALPVRVRELADRLELELP